MEEKMYIVFLAVLIIFVLIPAVSALIEKRKPEDKDVVFTEKMRYRQYFQSFAFLWGSALAFFILMRFFVGVSLEDIGIRQISFNNGWITVVTLVLYGLAVGYFLYIIIMSLTSARYREKAEKQIAGNRGIDMVLPRSKKGKWIFAFVAFSAGICEETLYRGFFVFLLQAVFPDIPVYLIILIPTVLFGISHFYQGMQGVINTGITGAVLMCLFLATGSLIPCMALHFLMDFSSTFLRSEEQAEGN